MCQPDFFLHEEPSPTVKTPSFRQPKDGFGRPLAALLGPPAASPVILLHCLVDDSKDYKRLAVTQSNRLLLHFTLGDTFRIEPSIRPDRRHMRTRALTGEHIRCVGVGIKLIHRKPAIRDILAATEPASSSLIVAGNDNGFDIGFGDADRRGRQAIVITNSRLS